MDWFSEPSEKTTSAIQGLYNLPPDQVSASDSFKTWILNSTVTKDVLLASIPPYPTDPHRPLHVLLLVLRSFSGQELRQQASCLNYHYARLVQDVHIDGTAGAYYGDAETEALVDSVKKAVKRSYNSLTSLISANDEPALHTMPSSDHGSISRRRLVQFIDNFVLPLGKTTKQKARIAIFVQDETLAAALTIAVSTYYTAVPLDASVADLDRIKEDLERAGVDGIITTRDFCEGKISELRPWLAQKDVRVFLANRDEGGIRLRCERGQRVANAQHQQPKPNRGDDVALVLFTRGTWSERSCVEFKMHDLLVEAFKAVQMWELRTDDVCVNMAPISAMGGLTLGILSSILSGGAVMSGSPSDVTSFWAAIEDADIAPTWYLAAIPAHRAILAEAPFHGKSIESCNLRLTCGVDEPIPNDLGALISDTMDCEVCTKSWKTPATANEELSADPAAGRGRSASTATARGRALSAASTLQEEEMSPTTTTSFSQKLALSTRRPSRKESQALEPVSEGFNFFDDRGYLSVFGTASHLLKIDDCEVSAIEVEQAVSSANQEEDSPIYERVQSVLAFSVPHASRGCAVGVVLVHASDQLRVDLRTLHNALRGLFLDESKWPALVVYMDNLPGQWSRDVMRTRLAERMRLPPLTDETSFLARHWEATCPAPDASIMQPIRAAQCKVDHESLTEVIRGAIPSHFDITLEADLEDGGYEVFIGPEERTPELEKVAEEWSHHIRRLVALSLHGYMIPGVLHVLSEPLVRDDDGAVNGPALRELRTRLRKRSLPKPIRSIEERVRAIFSKALGFEEDAISTDDSFFSLGGNNVLAEKVLSKLRVEFNMELPGDLLGEEEASRSEASQPGTIQSVTDHIEKCIRAEQPVKRENSSGKRYSSTNWWLMALQLWPLVIMFPARGAAFWTFQLWLLSRTRFWADTATFWGRLVNLTLSISGAWASTEAIFPWIGILCKWAIIGRYKEGLYPMWGPYHTRWWFVQKIVSLSGTGFFDVNDHGRSLYCRLMGAKIGRGVKMSGVSLGEWDLLDIRDGAVLNKCLCRPFAAETNTSMYLRRIIIGERASIGVHSVIAPGSEILPDTFIGVNSSSWEQRDSSYRDDSAIDTPPISDPHWILKIVLTWPIYFLGWLLSYVPWVGAQFWVLYQQPTGSKTPLRIIITWFQSNPAVAFHYVAVMLKALVSPFIFLFFAVSLRWLTTLACGLLPSDATHVKSHWARWRATLMRNMFPESQLAQLNALLGQHHEARSWALRMLGTTVGHRVSWAITGPSITDYHLLNIEDEATIGADSQLLTTDEFGSAPITIGKGAVVADHACVLPGVTVGHDTTLGFGTLTRRGRAYADGHTYVGCQNGDIAHDDSYGQRLWEVPDLEKGFASATPVVEHRNGSDATLVDDELTVPDRTVKRLGSRESISDDDDLDVHEEEGDEDNLTRMPIPRHKHRPHRPHRHRDHRHRHNLKVRVHKSKLAMSQHSPFNRAFFGRNAPYHVLSPAATLSFSMFMAAFTVFYWNVPPNSAMKLASRIFVARFEGIDPTYDPIVLYLFCFIGNIALSTSFAVVAIAIVLGAKRALIGRYEVGTFDWDKGPYCQRWQLFRAVEKLLYESYVERGMLSLLTGTHWLVMYYRVMGARIGADCCLFANGSPALMITETDLLEVGDRAVIDDVGIVSHLDRRGSVQLRRIKIGNRCVLRSGSNVLSGVVMEDDSCLLEHTLVLPGEVVKAGQTLYRRPGERFYGNRKGTLAVER